VRLGFILANVKNTGFAISSDEQHAFIYRIGADPLLLFYINGTSGDVIYGIQADNLSAGNGRVKVTVDANSEYMYFTGYNTE
jgi:hypothetical protein